MTKLTLTEQEELFARDCKLINLKYEYTGYTGKEKWAIITALSETELTKKYPDEITNYCPFILLSVEQGEAIIEFHNYEAKERMRNLRYGHAFDIDDGEFEEHHPEIAKELNLEECLALKDDIERLYFAIAQLTDVQKRRVVEYFFKGKNFVQIGNEEGVNYVSVKESVYAAIKKLRKFFWKTPSIFCFPVQTSEGVI